MAGVRFGNIHLKGNGKWRTSDIVDAEGNPIAAADANWENDAILWEPQDEITDDSMLTYLFPDGPVSITAEDTDLMDGGKGFGSFLMMPQQTIFATESAEA